jgi:hypothetical protein
MLEDPGNERPFAPPPSRTAPTLLIALAMGVMAFAGYRAMDWWSVRPAVRPAPQEMAARAPSEMGSSAPLPVRRPPADGRVQADASRIEAPPAWTRCEAGGKVSYSDTGCGGGAQKSNAHTTQAAVTTVPTNRSSGTTTLYRIRAWCSGRARIATGERLSWTAWLRCLTDCRFKRRWVWPSAPCRVSRHQRPLASHPGMRRSRRAGPGKNHVKRWKKPLSASMREPANRSRLPSRTIGAASGKRPGTNNLRCTVETPHACNPPKFPHCGKIPS